MAEGRIEQYDIVSKEAVETVETLQTKLSGLADQIKQINIVIIEASKVTGQYKTDMDSLTKTESELIKVEQASNDFQKGISNTTVELISAQQKLAQSKKDLRDQIKQENLAHNENLGVMKKIQLEIAELKKKRDAVTESDKNYEKTIKNLSKEITAHEERLKSLSSEQEKGRLNVGRYKESIEKLIPGFGGMAEGIKGMTKAAWEFIATPIGMTLAAVGLAVMSVKEYFEQSEEGQNKWNKVMNEGKAVMEVFKEKAAKLGGDIVGLGEKSSGFGKILKEQVINRLAAYAMMLEAVSKATHGKFIDAIKEAGQAMSQMLTGVDFWNNKITQDMKNEIDERIKLADKYSEMQAARDKEEREDEIEIAKLKLISAKARNEAMEKDKLTIEQRMKLMEKSLEAEKKIAQIEMDDSKRDLKIAEEKFELNKKDKEAIDELYKAKAKVIEAETAYYNNTRRLVKQLATFRIQLEKEQQEAAKNTLETEKIGIEESMDTLKTAQDEKRDEINTTLKLQLAAYKKDIEGSVLKEEEKKKLLREASKIENQILLDNQKYAENITMQQYQKLVNEYKLKNEQIKAMDKDLSVEQIDRNEETLTKLINAQRQFLLDKKNAGEISEQEYQNKISSLAQDEISVHKNAQDQILAYQEKSIKEKERLEKESYKIGQDLVGTSGSLLNSHYENQTIKLKREEQKQLSNTRLNESQKNAIKKEYAIKEAEIQRKQAIVTKAMNISETVQNTAKAVMEIASTGGGTHYADFGVWAAVLEGITIALGAAKVAQIAAQPLPEIPSFKEGVDDFKGGLATIHGKELIKLPTGQKFITLGGIDDPINTILPAHTKVVSNEVLREQVLNLPKTTSSDEVMMQNHLLSELLQETKKDKPMVQFNMDADGISAYTSSKNSYIQRINTRFRGRA